MTKVEILQLKKGAIILATVANGLREPNAKIEILEITKVFARAIRELEINQEKAQ